MIASNMDKLGAAHPICKDIKLDDGKLGITIIDDTHSRAGTVSAAMNLKKVPLILLNFMSMVVYFP